MDSHNLLNDHSLSSMSDNGLNQSKEYFILYENLIDTNENLSDTNISSQFTAVDETESTYSKKIELTKPIKRPGRHVFEKNPSIRRKQQTRLLRKLCSQIEEYNVRIGQQAIFATCSKDSSNISKSFRVFGSQPLESIVKARKHQICELLEELTTSELLQQESPNVHPQKFELPPLVLNGEPCPLELMTQTQLRCFIPEMLRVATGRSRPGWGKAEHKPPWWPENIPWENIRIDSRDEEHKKMTSWTLCLRDIVRSCYKYYDRVDLLLDDLVSSSTGDYSISVDLVSEKEFLQNTSKLNAEGKKVYQFVLDCNNKLTLDNVNSTDTTDVDEVIMCIQSNKELKQLLKDGNIKIEPGDYKNIINQLSKF